MNNIKIGEYIKQRIKEKGVTQDQLAEMLGVTSPAVSQVLNGKNMFDYPNMMNLSKILDESVDKIINAGEEAETYLEELSKLTIENYEKIDPKYNKIKDIDSKSKTLFDYLMKNKNYPLTIKLIQKGFYYNELKDIRFETLLIENNDEENFSKQSNHSIMHSELCKDVYDGEYLNPYDSYSNIEKDYIKALVHCKNEAILNHIQYLSSNQNANHSPAILFYAIQFDQVNLIQYYEEKQNLKDNKLRNVLTKKYQKYFNFAIRNQSHECMSYFYESLSEFNTKDYFSTLLATKDMKFIQDFLNKYKSKSSGYHHYDQDERFNNYEALKPLIDTNDLMLMVFAIEFSNQEALNRALNEVKTNQIEMMKVLLRKGASFQYRDGYSTDNVEQDNLSAFVTALLNQLESKK